jgi:hypothetical protein
MGRGMLEIILSLVLGSSTADDPVQEALTAVCQVATVIRGRQIREVSLQCPDDVVEAAQLQHYADAVSAQVAMPVRLTALNHRETLRFVFMEGGWVLNGPQSFYLNSPRYPSSAASRNLDGRCDLTLNIASDGAARIREIVCQGFRISGQVVSELGFRREARRTISQGRWFMPLGVETTCITTNFHSYIEDIGRPGLIQRPWLLTELPDAPVCP